MNQMAACLAILATGCATAPSGSEIPRVAYTGSLPLPASSADQKGASFKIRELSGITRLDGDRFLAVSDGRGMIVELEVVVADDGAPLSVDATGGISLVENRDYEGIARGPALAGEVYLSEEDAPAVRAVALADGGPSLALPTPVVFAHLRPNRGFESLAYSCSTSSLWTANEEALSVDGPTATPSHGTVVRLLRYDLSSGSAVPAEQLAYEVEPLHGPALPGGSSRSGVSDLVALPDGRLLALERSLALATPHFLTRIYLVDPRGATDVSDLPALAGASYTPVAKTLLYQGGHSNLEGLTVGRALADGAYSLIGVVDDGGPIGAGELAAFVVSGIGVDACAAGAGLDLAAGSRASSRR